MATAAKDKRAPAPSLRPDEINKLIEPPGHGLAAPLLRHLAENNFTDWKTRTFRRGEIVARFNNSIGLYLVLSGNAHLYIPHSEGLRGIYEGLPEIQGFYHPMVLCEGDLIGEFEVWQQSPSLAAVKAGAPMGCPGAPNARPQLKLLELPTDQLRQTTVLRETVFRSLFTKLAALNELLRIALSKKPLESLLPFFFNGTLPVFGFCVKQADGTLARRNFAGGLALGKISLDEEVRGIEVTSNYLEKCFGISDYTTKGSLADQHTGSGEDYYWRRTAEEVHPSFVSMTETVDAPPKASGTIQFLLRKDLSLLKYLERYGARPRSF